MSTSPGIPFQDAYRLAEEAAASLAPTLDELKAVGSLRRKRKRVGDIEFLARPHFETTLLGDELTPCLDDVRRVLREIGTWVQGGDRAMRVTDLLGHEGVRLELYLVQPPAAWGSMLAIRTGPAELGQHVVTRMREVSKCYHASGHARRLQTHELVPTDTEAEFFALAGLPLIPPARREAFARSLGLKPKVST